MSNRKLGSIALARSLCYQINGAADDSDDIDGNGYGSVDIAEILSAEVERLQAALAQLEQKAEPVAWMFQHSETGRMNYVSNDGRNTPDLFLKTNLRYALVCPLYAAPPQRPWVGLTEEEVKHLYPYGRSVWGKETFEAIEKALKEKNSAN